MGLRARALSAGVIAILVATITSSVMAEDVVEVFPEDNEDAASSIAESDQSDLWFVELMSPPTADGTEIATVRAEKDVFRANAARAGLAYTELYAFDTLWNGLSISLDPSQISTLRRIDGVKNIWPVATMSVPAVGPDEGADLATAVAQTGANLANAAGWTGAGVRVAIMDTGIDYHHPDLGGCFGAGCRVATGFDFVGSAFTGANTPVPDPDPDDCNGHGTHVAGIVGANGGVKGVARDVTFGAYRVFGCGGFTRADIMIVAMEKALGDDMDVLNMSIGSALQSWPNYPTAAASDRAVNKGMVVVASIGNSGPSGVYSASAPGVGKKVIGVASYDNSHIRLPFFTVTPDAKQIGYQRVSLSAPTPTSGSFPMARTGTPASTEDACSALLPGSLAGKVALVRRGTCSFRQKAVNVQNAGAAAIVIYNSAPGLAGFTFGTPLNFIGVGISGNDGVLLNNRIVAGATTMTWTASVSTFPNPAGSLISGFSSYGLAADLSLKPDIGAPGGLIRSTVPVEQGSYATISGTSMSSPHVAGAAALLLQARPNTPAQAVRSILQNSADPKVWSLSPGLGFLDHVHRQGAGMLDIDDAINATTTIEPGKLSLGESQSGPVTSTLTISNESSSPVTYDLSHTPALATAGNTNAPSFFNAPAGVAFSASSLTVPANGSATVDVTIAPNPGLPDRGQYGGYIVFTPQGGGQTYRVPFAGLKGDYQSITAITPTTCPVALPAIGKKGSSNFCGVDIPVPFTLPASGLTFTLSGGDVPYVVFHLDHQVRRVRIEVFDATTGEPRHRAFETEYLGRNGNNGFFWVTWDGTTSNGTKVNAVPDGQYVLVLSIQKALGDDSDPAHFESWTSPVITIDRP